MSNIRICIISLLYFNFCKDGYVGRFVGAFQNINGKSSNPLRQTIDVDNYRKIAHPVKYFGNIPNKLELRSKVEDEEEDDSLLHRDLERSIGLSSDDEDHNDAGDVVCWEQLIPKWAINRNPNLRVEQIEIIRMSWDSIKYHPPGLDKLVSDFYDRIWTDAPQLRKLFTLDLTKQHGKFSAAFDLLIKLLDQDDVLRKELKSLAERHANYGAKAADYPVFVEALLYSIEQYSPLLWNPNLLEAWMDLFTIVMETVLPVAWELEQKDILDHTLEGGSNEEDTSNS